MFHFNLRFLFLVAALTIASFNVHAQLNCSSPGSVGSGDQGWGTGLPNGISDAELYNACGTVALGYFSLYNDSGSLNTAMGNNAMFTNTTGANNSSYGANSLYSNVSGANNTAFGYETLYSNTTGKGNAAQGVNALFSNTTGIRNLGIGNNALYSSNGSYNIGLGFDAGYYITTGSNNIEIGAYGTAEDNNTIQIGAQGTQTKTTIAGIYGAQVTGGSAVYVTSTGQLGVQGSSERFKTDIATMPEMSNKIDQLRPVTFRYKADPKKVTQYGLIAEEVAKVYPELVIRDDTGKIQGVHYEELAPILLSQTQRQQRRIDAQEAKLAVQSEALAAQASALGELKQQLADLAQSHHETQVALSELRGKDSQVAMR